MRPDPEPTEKPVRTTAPEPVAKDANLHQVMHDVQNCLQVIGLGTELLKGARDDDETFADVCDGIDRERREAVRLVSAYLRSTHEGH